VRVGDFERILSAAGHPVPRAVLERAYEASGAWLASVWRSHRDVPVQEHVAAILRAADPALPSRLSAATLRALQEAYGRPALAVPPTVDTGARAALQALRGRGCALAVVSNTMRTPGAVLRRLLAHYGLLECFAHTVFSDELGVRKPDPAIFHEALRAVEGEPATAVHVGDDPVLDVQGALAAGMRVIQVSSAARPSPSGPHAVIRDLAALPAAVDGLDGG